MHHAALTSSIFGADTVATPTAHASTSCADSSEEQTFRSECASVIADMDGHLRSTVAHRRSLTIFYPGSGSFGIGHVLNAALGLHYLCRHLERFCRVRVFDAELETWFGYANGMSWKKREEPFRVPEPAEPKGPFDFFSTKARRQALSELEQVKNGSIAVPQLVRNQWKMLSEAERAPFNAAGANDTARYAAECEAESFARVWGGTTTTHGKGAKLVQRLEQLNGTQHLLLSFSLSAVPWDFHDALGPGTPLRWEGAAARLFSKPSRCFCRYVTAPRPALLARAGAAVDGGRPYFDAALHLRTMFADLVHGRQLNATSVCDSAEAKRWLDVACAPSATARLFEPTASGRAARVLVLSDSPGVLSAMRQRHPSLTPGEAIASQRTATRSWRNGKDAKGSFSKKLQDAARLNAILDVYRLGLAATVHAGHSAFTSPGLARSVCVREVVALGDAGRGACPAWRRTFIRDFPKFVDGGRHGRDYGDCFGARLDAEHPCRSASAVECRERLVAATCSE